MEATNHTPNDEGLASDSGLPIEGFRRDLEQLFREACSNSEGAITRHYAFAGIHLGFTFANEKMFSLLNPALEHLADDEFKPTVGSKVYKISVWDSKSTNTRIIPPAWELDQVKGDCSIEGFDSGSGFCRTQIGLNIVHLLDLDTSSGIYWAHDADDIPWWECVSPFRILLNRIAEHENGLIVHAAAVGDLQGRAGLLIGKGGSGKSTTALSCACHGLLHGGDDSVLVSLSRDQDPPTATAHTLYGTAKLTSNSLNLLPELRQEIHSHVGEGEDQKALFYLNDFIPDQLLENAELKFIANPVVGHQDKTIFEIMPKQQMLLALAPNSLFPIPGSGKNKFKEMARLVSALPCYRISLGKDPKEVADSMRRFLSEI